MGDLLIRAGQNDHEIIADLLAPAADSPFALRRETPVSALVIDAHVARKRPRFGEVAAQAAVPLIIDPVTPLLQGELATDDSWARLPFGRRRSCSLEDFEASTARTDLVRQTVDFQMESGASVIVPPYLYASSPGDPWFAVSLDLIRITRDVIDETGLRLPLFPILCAQLQTFAVVQAPTAVEDFVNTCRDVGVEAVALCLSPTGSRDSYNKLLRLFETSLAMTSRGVRVYAWRQGTFGPALVAAGLDGYETGIGTREYCNIPRMVSSRRPRDDGKRSGGAAPGIYVEVMGRSIPRKVAETLFSHQPMRARLMCSDEACCPHGVASTLDRHREHAIQSRARSLKSMSEVPHVAWRMHRTCREAEHAVVMCRQANALLAGSGVKEQIEWKAMASLARVSERLRDHFSGRGVA